MTVARAPFAFTDAAPGEIPWAALDRADHLRHDPVALGALWAQSRVLLLDADGQALADAQRMPSTPRGEQLSEGPGGVGAATFLGLDPEGEAWFSLEAALTAFDAPQRIDLRSAATLWPAFPASVFAQARAVQHWRNRHRFCGVCGSPVAMQRGGWLGVCGGCGIEHYPRTDPAVIVAVGDGDRILLGRQSSWPERRWSVIAGFVEPGESLEQAVAREVAEETSLRVRSCHYLASQPWPFPSALMLGFIAQAEPDEPRVTEELEEARWFTVEEIRAAQARDDAAMDDGGPLLSPPISIARWLIEQWLARACATASSSGVR
ncbi:NAD(+) diphosphatase [Montanilutibacter psychrotolerans]|uniref:NAD(+) diphosphatase n=1 Tax=Montanilutibacter psychrotolerans TaxID=1327343 RepID=UPI0026AB2FEC